MDIFLIFYQKSDTNILEIFQAYYKILKKRECQEKSE